MRELKQLKLIEENRGKSRRIETNWSNTSFGRQYICSRNRFPSNQPECKPSSKVIMSKIVPMDLINFMRGKVCMHSDFYFQKRNGTIFTGRRCESRNLQTNPYSENELANQAKFRAARSAMASLTEEQKAAYKTAFRKQNKYPTLQGYIFAQEYKNLTI